MDDSEPRERANIQDYQPTEDDDYDTLMEKATAVDENRLEIRRKLSMALLRVIEGTRAVEIDWFHRITKAKKSWDVLSNKIQREMRAIERMDLAARFVSVAKVKMPKEQFDEYMRIAGSDDTTEPRA